MYMLVLLFEMYLTNPIINSECSFAQFRLQISLGMLYKYKNLISHNTFLKFVQRLTHACVGFNVISMSCQL